MGDETSSLYYQAKLKAIENTLRDDGVTFYRQVTRWYSKEYSTPLHHVRTRIPYTQILQEYYEHELEDMDYNDVYEYAMRDMLPEFMEEFDDMDEEFAKSLIEEQKQQLENKKKREIKTKAKDEIEVEEGEIKKPKPEEVEMKFEDEDGN